MALDPWEEMEMSLCASECSTAKAMQNQDGISVGSCRLITAAARNLTACVDAALSDKRKVGA